MLYSPSSHSVCLVWHPVASTITSVTSPFAEILLCSTHAELHSVPQNAVHFYTLTLLIPQVISLPGSISHFPLWVAPLFYALWYLYFLLYSFFWDPLPALRLCWMEWDELWESWGRWPWSLALFFTWQWWLIKHTIALLYLVSALRFSLSTL